MLKISDCWENDDVTFKMSLFCAFAPPSGSLSNGFTDGLIHFCYLTLHCDRYKHYCQLISVCIINKEYIAGKKKEPESKLFSFLVQGCEEHG